MHFRYLCSYLNSQENATEHSMKTTVGGQCLKHQLPRVPEAVCVEQSSPLCWAVCVAGLYGHASTENWHGILVPALHVGMIFCRKTINYQKNGIPKLHTHFKSRDFESVSPTKEYTNHQDTLRFHRMFQVWLCNPIVKALRGKIQGSAHAPWIDLLFFSY